MFRLSIALLIAVVSMPAQAEDWKSIYDGKSFKGWTKTENKDSWKIEDGNLVCVGERSHLFYTGDEKPFKNFEFECEVKTTKGSNAGIYFHTKLQEQGWPKYGYECQVNIGNAWQCSPNLV